MVERRAGRTVAGTARIVVSDMNVTEAGFRADDDRYRLSWTAAAPGLRSQGRDRDRLGRQKD